RNGSVGTDNDVVLSPAAVPVGEVKAGFILDDTGHGCDLLRDITVGPGAVPIPPVLTKVDPGGHAHERFHLLQALHRVHHLVAGFVLLDNPIHQIIHGAPIFRTDIGW